MSVSYYGTNTATGDGHLDKIVSSASGTSVQQTTGTNTFNTVGYLEILSQGGTPSTQGALPSTGGDSNSGGGWYDLHLLNGVAVPAGNWSIKCNIKASDTSNPTGTLYAIFWDLNDNAVTYTYIGTSTGQALTITNTSQEVTLTATGLSAYTFGSTGFNGLVAAIWWHQTSGGTGTTTISVSVPTSGTVGVTGDNGGLEFILPSSAGSVTLQGTDTITLEESGTLLVSPNLQGTDTWMLKELGSFSIILAGTDTFQLSESGTLVAFALKGTDTFTLSESGLIPVGLSLPTIPPPPMPIISFGAPAYASNINFSPSRANDVMTDINTGGYLTQWNSSVAPTTQAPQYLAYDLSGVPVAQRQQVVVSLLNEGGFWRNALDGGSPQNLFQNYTIDINTAAGGSLPASGWTTLVTITLNDYHTRQHVVNMAGANWIRINCTAAGGTAPNNNLALNMDIHDAHMGAMDRWMWVGDSWTEEGFIHIAPGGPNWGTAVPGALSQVVFASTNGLYQPATIAGGNPGWKFSDALGVNNSEIGDYLGGFTGGFTVLAFGVNDTNTGAPFTAGDANVRGIYANLLSMIDAATAQNNIVIVPLIPYTLVTFQGPNALLVNAWIQAHLPHDRPNALIGPDFGTFFHNNPGLIRTSGGGANLHPTFQETVAGVADGYEWMHSIWSQWMIQYVYQLDTSLGQRGVIAWAPDGHVTAVPF